MWFTCVCRQSEAPRSQSQTLQVPPSREVPAARSETAHKGTQRPHPHIPYCPLTLMHHYCHSYTITTPSYTVTPCLRHHYCTPQTPLLRHTPLLPHSNTITTPSYIITTPLIHHYYLLKHHYYPLIHHYCHSHTPLLSLSYTITTPSYTITVTLIHHYCPLVHHYCHTHTPLLPPQTPLFSPSSINAPLTLTKVTDCFLYGTHETLLYLPEICI